MSSEDDDWTGECEKASDEDDSVPVPRLRDLLRDVASKIPKSMWQKFATELLGNELSGRVISSHLLNTFRQVFNLWRKNKAKPYTWATILTVLKEVGQYELAEMVHARYSCRRMC